MPVCISERHYTGPIVERDPLAQPNSASMKGIDNIEYMQSNTIKKNPAFHNPARRSKSVCIHLIIGSCI
jgi:hypothetical protein